MTPSGLSRISLFQKRTVLKPFVCNHCDRFVSYCCWSICCPPSNSMISFSSRQIKSTMYLPMGCCLRKRKPCNWRLRILAHSIRSTSVILLRRWRELFFIIGEIRCILPPSRPSPLKGEGVGICRSAHKPPSPWQGEGWGGGESYGWQWILHFVSALAFPLFREKEY